MNKQEQADQLFREALDQPRDKRGAFLDRVCAGKPVLHQMVEDLLDENDRLSGLLTEPAFTKDQAAAGLAFQTLVLASGKRLQERYLITGNWAQAEWAWSTERGTKSSVAKLPLRCCSAEWSQEMKPEDGFGVRPRLSQK